MTNACCVADAPTDLRCNLDGFPFWVMWNSDEDEDVEYSLEIACAGVSVCLPVTFWPVSFPFSVEIMHSGVKAEVKGDVKAETKVESKEEPRADAKQAAMAVELKAVGSFVEVLQDSV